MEADKYTSEQLTERGLDPTKFCGHYSKDGFYIRKAGTNEEYIEAVDLLPCTHEYVVTDKPLPVIREENKEALIWR